MTLIQLSLKLFLLLIKTKFNLLTYSTAVPQLQNVYHLEYSQVF